jgi:hypothetical protein
MALTIDEVLRDIPRAPAQAKVAADLASVEGPVTHAGLARKLAELTRSIPEPQVSWASLYAVKQAGYRNSPPSFSLEDADDSDERPGAPLRKLASAVRNYENVRAGEFFQKNANALKAIRGLTLLRERVRP